MGMARKDRPELDMSSTRFSCPGGFRPVHFNKTWAGSPGRQRERERSPTGNPRKLLAKQISTLKKTRQLPFIGLSLVSLNSETGTLEKPARKSRLLTPVTLRVWRPLQLTFEKDAIRFSDYGVIK